jgi:hypothetical protein
MSEVQVRIAKSARLRPGEGEGQGRQRAGGFRTVGDRRDAPKRFDERRATPVALGLIATMPPRPKPGSDIAFRLSQLHEEIEIPASGAGIVSPSSPPVMPRYPAVRTHYRNLRPRGGRRRPRRAEAIIELNLLK